MISTSAESLNQKAASSVSPRGQIDMPSNVTLAGRDPDVTAYGPFGSHTVVSGPGVGVGAGEADESGAGEEDESGARKIVVQQMADGASSVFGSRQLTL
jgi:hypothetical protein